MNITTDDILDAIRADIELRKTETGEDGATGTEIAAVMACSPLTARRHIKRLLESGRMEVVTLTRMRIDGIRTPIRGYRLKG